MVEGFLEPNVRSKAEEKVGKVPENVLGISCIRDNINLQLPTPKLKWQITLKTTVKSVIFNCVNQKFTSSSTSCLY